MPHYLLVCYLRFIDYSLEGSVKFAALLLFHKFGTQLGVHGPDWNILFRIKKLNALEIDHLSGCPVRQKFNFVNTCLGDSLFAIGGN